MAKIYGRLCEAGNCYCVLSRGVTLAELLGGDGPENPISAAERISLAERESRVYSDTQATEETT